MLVIIQPEHAPQSQRLSKPKCQGQMTLGQTAIPLTSTRSEISYSHLWWEFGDTRNLSLFVVEEVDGVLFDVSALVIILDDHPDVFVPGHALHLAIGEAQAERPSDGRTPQVVRGERLFAFIEAGEACPAVDDLADVPCRKRLVEFESAEVH